MTVALSPGITTPATNGIISSEPSLEPANPPTFDIEVFRNYILTLLPPVLGASIDELEGSLFDQDFEDRVSKFAAEPGAVVYVLKRKDEVTGNRVAVYRHILATSDTLRTDDVQQTYSYTLTTHLTYSSSHVATLALIKRGPSLDSTIPLPPQIHLLNLFAGEESPYEGLHAMVSSAMKPWFEAFVGARGANKDGDGKLGKHKHSK
jgi:hypothetical protein